MALKRVSSIYFLADEMADLASIEPEMGLECYVISEGCEYCCTSDGRWFSEFKACTEGAPSAGESVDLSNYATHEEVENAVNSIDLSNFATHEEVENAINGIEIPSMEKFVEQEYVDNKIADVNKHLEAFYRPVKYDISSVPEGTIVDYREKEIRVFCPSDVVFTKQNVGANGNANMHYMTFKAYAPEGAVSFKEGDRGTIIDEMFTFEDSAAGVDKYGRKYSVCWLALASYDESADKWTYFGATSNTSKYIGWTYIVEWYDANQKMIGTDKIRINLSNADCHLALAPYYG